MPEIKDLLGKESLLAIKDYIDTKTDSAGPKTEVVDLDTFVACENTALIQHFGEELPLSADDFIFTYFFVGNKCVLANDKYESISGLDITEAQYNAIKDCLLLNLTSDTIPVMMEMNGEGALTLRKQTYAAHTEEDSTYELVYFRGATHNIAAVKLSGIEGSSEDPLTIYELYYFKATDSSSSTRDYINFTNADQLSDAELAEVVSSSDFNVLLNKAVKVTKGWKKTVPIADVYKYYPWDVVAGDDHAYRDNFMWVSVPGRTLTIDYLQPGPFILLFQVYVSDSLIALVGGTNDEGVIEVLQYEPALNEAAAFSTTSTYAVGSLVTYQGKLYKCTTAVTTAGSWSDSKWTQVTVNDAFLPLTAGQNKALTGVLYSDVNDVSFVGKQGKIGFRAYKPNTTDNAGQMLITSDGTVDGSYRLSVVTYNKTQSDATGTAVYNALRVGDTEGLTYKIGSDVLLKVNDSGTATVAANPVNNLDVATKQYVDSKPNLIETTWSALKSLRDNSQLVPGRFYRITDYTCTTTQANTSSAGHVFDIIVRADSTNKLNEEASAILHEGDTYFTNNNLSAWKIWYCLDNNTNRFAWAQSFMDEHLLYAPGYMQPVPCFREPQFDGVNGNYCWYCPENDIFIFTDTLTPTTGSRWMLVVDSWTKVEDGVSVQYVPAVSDGKGVIYRMIDEFNNDVPYDFKNILFTDSSSTPKYTNAYTFSYTANSTIKDASMLGLSKSCYSNVMKEYITSNRRLNFNIFYSNSTSFSCYNNTFDAGCYNNTFNQSCYNNTFGYNFYNNTFGKNCDSNTFAYNCSSNTLGNYCRINTFGKNCSNNTLETYCDNNTLGTSCSNNTFIQSCSYNTVDNNCKFLNITGTGPINKKLQNVHIHSGVAGTSSSDRKTITVARDLSYETNIVPAGTTTTEV